VKKIKEIKPQNLIAGDSNRRHVLLLIVTDVLLNIKEIIAL